MRLLNPASCNQSQVVVVLLNEREFAIYPNAGVIDSSIYSESFSTQPMRTVWSDTVRIQRYLDVEEALAKHRRGSVSSPNKRPTRSCVTAASKMDFGKSATEHIGYPVPPVVQQLVAICANGMGLVGPELNAIADALAALAKKHRDTPMIGRSNLQQAVPMTFGYQAAVWLTGIDRHRERLTQLKPRVLMGEFGGAVGTLASLGDKGLLVQPRSDSGTDVKVMMATELAEAMEPDDGGRGHPAPCCGNAIPSPAPASPPVTLPFSRMSPRWS